MISTYPKTGGLILKKIVIIGANDFQNQLIIKAKDLGYQTHVFAWEEDAVGKNNADYFYPISIIEKEKILEICKKIKPGAITSVASDLAMITVNFIAQKLNLVCNGENCVKFTTNKYEMRKQLKKSSISTHLFYEVGLNQDISHLNKTIKFPVIVKPTDRSGSRAITKVSSFSQLNDAIKRAISNSFEKKAIIEEYIDGEEYSCECITFKGNHYFLALTKKFTTGSPNFIETGHIQPSGISHELQSKIIKVVFKCLTALQIENGASHTEFKITKNGEIKIIEIGARMGGDCIGSDLVKISTGYDFLKMVIDIALNKAPDFTKINEENIGIIKFIFSQADIDKLNKIKTLSPNYIYRISNLEPISSKQVVDSSSRFGYYIITCKNKNEVERLNIL